MLRRASGWLHSHISRSLVGMVRVSNLLAERGRAARVAPAAPTWTTTVALLAMLASTTALSQFFRSSTSVIGPELIRDLALSPEALGFANGSFFMAVFLGQIPVGIAFDRFGVRLTVAFLSVPMAAGAMLHGVADTGMQLAAARFLVGLGCAGSYTAGIVVISRWFRGSPGAR